MVPIDPRGFKTLNVGHGDEIYTLSLRTYVDVPSLVSKYTAQLAALFRRQVLGELCVAANNQISAPTCHAIREAFTVDSASETGVNDLVEAHGHLAAVDERNLDCGAAQRFHELDWNCHAQIVTLAH